MKRKGVFRQSLAWVMYRARSGRWIRERRKTVKKAGKVFECMLRRTDLFFSVDTERICMPKQRNIMYKNADEG